ncbi:MAG: DUF1553 domain-containing protein [Planctomycetaceae bacterium]|nr:DUF1553 domain-containing protein [Planctomycetaceae bacterium]
MLSSATVLTAADRPVARTLDSILAAENAERGVKHEALPVVDDLAFLRRVYVDLIGRIPTTEEISTYQALPSATRREQTIDSLLQHPRFADRWTVFFADMLRMRSNAEGGAQLVAYVHRAVQDGMPYDELCRKLIATNGKVGRTPEVGFVLGDNADPMALTGVTSQVFMGVRIACAQCHDHPFDVWTRKDFYGLAAYYGRTQRIERRFNNRILATYTTDVSQTSVMWPPEGVGPEEERKAMKPSFPIALLEEGKQPEYITRLKELRAAKANAELAAAEKKADPGLDDLLASAAEKAERRTRGAGTGGLGVLAEARQEAKDLNVDAAGSGESELRQQLARLVTSPRNEYFSRSFVNRIWAEMIGSGFVNPVDDFSGQNPPSHPQTLDFIAQEFVAGGYDLRSLVRMIAMSQTYQRAHDFSGNEPLRVEREAAFLATPVRRMLSEVMFDSIVTAGHLFQPKHEEGKNLKTVWRLTRIMKQPENSVRPVALGGQEKSKTMAAKPAMKKPDQLAAGYDLEKAIELDFNSLLTADDTEESESVEVDQMRVMSREELEAMRMAQESARRQADYIDRFVKAIVDDNPQFTSTMRIATPAAPEHFLRVFGQPGRTDLGDERDHSASMRGALMMLNGRLTHEASRVGEMEPVYPLIAGTNPDLPAAIRLAYLEILTREPTDQEQADAAEIIKTSDTLIDGLADFRWVLLNCNEFRFMP